MKNLKLEIYTPSGMIFDGEVYSVTLPGAKDIFTVLKDHGAIISSLKKGVIKYKIDKDDEEVFTIEVLGGFAEVKKNVVTVCLETVIK
ncbi:MAG: hypothetical protein GX921_03070 [Bacteroidales bacterium]|nr:hypothetical protein [Bacteroidales bacterium]